MNTKAAATAEGERVKALMKFGKWKLIVHENLGWHWTLVALDGVVSLSGSYMDMIPNRFHCLISEPGSRHAGSYSWHDNKRHSDPNRAVKATLSLMSAHLNQLKKHHANVTEALT